MASETRFNNPAGFEEELDAISKEDHAALGETQELERMYQLEQSRHEAKSMARREAGRMAANAMKSEARQAAGFAAKRGATMLAGEAASVIGMGTLAYYAAIVLAVVGVILGIIILVLTMAYYICSQEGWTGWAIRGMSTIANALGATQTDYCGIIADLTGETNGKPLPNLPPPPAPTVTGLVPITGIPLGSNLDPRVTSCMLARIQNVYALARAQNIDFMITSAYRPNAYTASGTLSAHSRGEAVDIVVIPYENWRQRPIYAAKVDSLLAIARSTAGGFYPPAGDALDEYRFKYENTTGDHIHLEFNIPANGTYCTLP